MIKAQNLYKKMKRYGLPAILLIALFLIGFMCVAQEQRNTISLSAGYSLPVGKFAKSKPDDPLSGLAGSGFYGQINYDRQIWKWLGLRFSGSFNNNSTNSGPVIDNANSYAAITGKTYGWQTDVSKWKFGAALIGPAVFYKTGKLLLEGHIQGGIVTAKTPSVHLTGQALTSTGQVDPTSDQIQLEIDQKSVTPFGFGGGVSIRYPVYKGLFVHLNSDIIAARAYVKNLAVRAKVGSIELADQITDKRFIGVINIGGGIGIAF